MDKDYIYIGKPDNQPMKKTGEIIQKPEKEQKNQKIELILKAEF